MNWGICVLLTFLLKFLFLKHEARNEMSVHLKLKRFACVICTKSFIRKYNLTRHEREEHQSDSSEPSSCFICNLTFLNKLAKKSHFRESHKNGVCNQCGKTEA